MVPAASQASLLFVKLIIDHFLWTADNNTDIIVDGHRLIQKHGTERGILTSLCMEALQLK